MQAAAKAGRSAAEPAAAAAAGEAAAAATLTLPVDEADADSSTIFVKNLAFATEDAALKKHFKAAAKAAGAGVAPLLVYHTIMCTCADCFQPSDARPQLHAVQRVSLV